MVWYSSLASRSADAWSPECNIPGLLPALLIPLSMGAVLCLDLIIGWMLCQKFLHSREVLVRSMVPTNTIFLKRFDLWAPCSHQHVSGMFVSGECCSRQWSRMPISRVFCRGPDRTNVSFVLDGLRIDGILNRLNVKGYLLEGE